MERSDIRAAIRDFLGLIEQGADSVAENEARLPVLLDRLALAQHFVSFTFDDSEHPDPPTRGQHELRALVCRRFPNYGWYNLPETTIEKIAESACVVGDAINDIADITSELQEVDWCWSYTSEDDALWRFQHNYRTHWSGHLRGLQLYLHALDWETQ